MNTEQLLSKYIDEEILVIAIDPSIREMGYARFCSGVLRKNSKAFEIPFAEQLSPEMVSRQKQQPLVFGTFKDTSQDNIFSRGLHQLGKIRKFVEGEIGDFMQGGGKGKSGGMAYKFGYNRSRYTFPNRLAYVVIEIPHTFYTGAFHRNAASGAKQAYMLGLVLGAFPNAIHRVVGRGSTLKDSAKSILTARDNSIGLDSFWKGANEHEIDAYMALEWFLENKFKREE